jgi:hypothetical protein
MSRTWGRCYDHNFLRFFPIFSEIIGVFLKYQCYYQPFQNLALFWVKNANFFAIFFGENILKIITSVPAPFELRVACQILDFHQWAAPHLFRIFPTGRREFYLFCRLCMCESVTHCEGPTHNWDIFLSHWARSPPQDWDPGYHDPWIWRIHVMLLLEMCL